MLRKKLRKTIHVKKLNNNKKKKGKQDWVVYPKSAHPAQTVTLNSLKIAMEKIKQIYELSVSYEIVSTFEQ